MLGPVFTFVIRTTAFIQLGLWPTVAESTSALPDVAEYDVVAIKFPLAQTIIGPKSAGFACIPAGKLRISDFLVSESDAAGATLTALESAGLTAKSRLLSYATRPNNQPAFALEVVVVSIDARLCAKKWVIGASSDFKGDGKFVFDWNIYSADTGKLLRSIKTESKTPLATKKLPGSLFSQGVAQAAVQFAKLVLEK